MNNDNLQGVVVGGQPINNGILPTDPSLVANGTVAPAAANVTPATPNIIASPVPPVTNDVVANNNGVNNAVGLGNIPIVNDSNIVAAPTGVSIVNDSNIAAAPTNVPIVNDSNVSTVSNNIPVINPSPMVGVVDNSAISNGSDTQVVSGDGIIPVSSSSVVPGVQSSSDASPVEVSSSPLTFDLPTVTSVDDNANNAFDIVNDSSIGSGTTDNVGVDGGNNGLGMVNNLGTNLSPSIPLNSDSSLNNSFITNGTSDSLTPGVAGINGVTDASGLNVQQNAVTPDNSATNDAQNNNDSDLSTVSLGTYLGHLFLFAIPVVGFIMLIVKAFDKKDKNLSNFAKAYLLFSIIICVVFAVLVVVATILFGNSAVNTVTGAYY